MCIFMFLLVASYISVGYNKVFNRCELAKELKHKHNIPEDQLATWVCIARYESHYNTTAVGHMNTDRSGDHGLFQVSDIYWCSPPGVGLECGIACSQLEDDDITDDVACVRRIYRAHQRQTENGFSAWAVYEPYCKNNVSRFIDDCFTSSHNKTETITQLPNVQTKLSKSYKNSTLSEIKSDRPWWLGTLENSINFENKNYISNITTLRPFSLYTWQHRTFNKNSVCSFPAFMQKPFQCTLNYTQHQEGLTVTQKPVWFNTHKTNLYSTRELSSTTRKLSFSSSTIPKPVLLSSTSTMSVLPSSVTLKPSAIPKRVWPLSHVFLSAQINNQKRNLFSVTRQTPMTTVSPVRFSPQTNLYFSRQKTSIVTQKPPSSNNQITYFKRKSNPTTTANPLWYHAQKTYAYSTQNQTSTTTHKPSWYQTWYQDNLVNTLFQRKKCNNCQ